MVPLGVYSAFGGRVIWSHGRVIWSDGGPNRMGEESTTNVLFSSPIGWEKKVAQMCYFLLPSEGGTDPMLCYA